MANEIASVSLATHKPIVFMFAGQGAHYYQMGQALFEQEPIFKQWLEAADRIYQNLTGLSIIHTLYYENNKKTDSFARTLLTHPAILMVEYALGQVLLAYGIQPDYVLGTSLGEFTAAVFAGMMSFETALLAVIKQAQILEMKCPPGSMLAILAPADLYQNDIFLGKRITLAADNFHSHFVVSGEPHHLTLLEQYLTSQTISFQRLAVSHAFHSPLIDQGATEYCHFASQQSISPPSLPFISCAYAQRLTFVSPSHWWDSIRLPIQFQATLKHLEDKNHYHYVDVGPSGTLATMVKYNLSADSTSRPYPLLTPFSSDIKNLKKVIECLTSSSV